MNPSTNTESSHSSTVDGHWEAGTVITTTITIKTVITSDGETRTTTTTTTKSTSAPVEPLPKKTLGRSSCDIFYDLFGGETVPGALHEPGLESAKKREKGPGPKPPQPRLLPTVQMPRKRRIRVRFPGQSGYKYFDHPHDIKGMPNIGPEPGPEIEQKDILDSEEDYLPVKFDIRILPFEYSNTTVRYYGSKGLNTTFQSLKGALAKKFGFCDDRVCLVVIDNITRAELSST